MCYSSNLNINNIKTQKGTYLSITLQEALQLIIISAWWVTSRPQPTKFDACPSFLYLFIESLNCKLCYYLDIDKVINEDHDYWKIVAQMLI